jgi:hypothetical protein
MRAPVSRPHHPSVLPLASQRPAAGRRARPGIAAHAPPRTERPSGRRSGRHLARQRRPRERVVLILAEQVLAQHDELARDRDGDDLGTYALTERSEWAGVANRGPRSLDRHRAGTEQSRTCRHARRRLMLPLSCGPSLVVDGLLLFPAQIGFWRHPRAVRKGRDLQGSWVLTGEPCEAGEGA